MDSIPDLLAKLEASPDDERRLELAHVTVLKLAERYGPSVEVVDRGAYERDMESLDRLADLIRQYNQRLKATLPPGG